MLRNEGKAFEVLEQERIKREELNKIELKKKKIDKEWF